jgi:hypothetical protein
VALGIITGVLLVGPGPTPSAAAAQEVVELPAGDRVLEPALQEVVRVGSLDGELWETFGEVRGVAFDGAGNLHVFDPRSARVVVVAPDGTFLREVGEAGEGPGELRTPVAFAVFRDGRVVIADMGHRAYLVYGPDGRFLRQLAMAGEGGLVRLGGLQADPTGRGVVHGGGGTMVSMRAGPGASPELPDARPVELLELDGEVATARTLVEGWQPPRGDVPTTLEGGGMRFRMATAGPRTFEPGLHVGVLPDGGVAVADSSTWAVVVTGPDGAVRRVLRRPLRPRPVTERVEEAERRRQLRELEEGEGPRMSITTRTGGGATRTVPREAIEEMMRGRIEQMRFHPEIPVIREMRSGWSGILWVQRRSADDPGEPGPVDLATPEGAYLGTIPESVLPLPDAFGPDGLAAFVERDAYDVPTVVVRRLPEALR